MLMRCRATMTGNLSAGFDAVSQDFKTIVWRIKQLGFNAIRLPVSFSHFAVRRLRVLLQTGDAEARMHASLLQLLCSD